MCWPNVSLGATRAANILLTCESAHEQKNTIARMTSDNFWVIYGQCFYIGQPMTCSIMKYANALASICFQQIPHIIAHIPYIHTQRKETNLHTHSTLHMHSVTLLHSEMRDAYNNNTGWHWSRRTKSPGVSLAPCERAAVVIHFKWHYMCVFARRFYVQTQLMCK